MTTASIIARDLKLARAGHGHTGDCPSCGYRGFTVEEKDGTVLVHCHAGGCSQAAVLAALRERGLWTNERKPTTKSAPVADLEPTDAGSAAVRIWQRSKAAVSTPVEAYLRSRGYRGPIPDTLRFQASGHHKESGQRLPMMVAGVGRIDEWRVVAVHRTFLMSDGSGKADVSPNKKSFGPVARGGVWLAPPAPVMCVSEGIETGLTCQQEAGIATVAALSASNMEQLILPPLPLAAEVVIAADHDPRGLRAAEVAARRWHTEGRTIRIAVPPQPGFDFNDFARLEVTGAKGRALGLLLCCVG